MPLPEEFLQRLKSYNTIDSVMSNYVSLKRAGRNYKCLCPFHSEKTASCVVYTDTDSFFCFGCGAGGDAITFTMKIENLNYYEAVKLLAERANIALPQDGFDDNEARQRQRIYEINRKSARFFFNQLKSPAGQTALKYLIDRGLSPETIKKYGLGFATDSWSSLRDYLLSEGYDEEDMVTANLVGYNRDRNRTFDVFRNRVMFPIIDLRGNVMAFGGRALDTEKEPRKYLNSSDTPVFKKSRNLFSLNFAKNVSVKEKRLILCEGYMDVISVNQAGFENAVATLGTAITQEQARLMSQYCDEVIICYDSDEAGQKATHKAINLLSEVGLTTRIIKMEGAKDPDEYIKKFGATRFKLLLDNSEGAIAFELEKCKKGLDLSVEIEKLEYLKRTFYVLADINSAVEREVYISRIADKQGVSKNVISAEIDALIQKRRRSSDKREWQTIASSVVRKKDTVNPDAERFPKEAKAEQGVIAYLFFHPDKADYIESRLPSESFVTSFNKNVYVSLLEKLKKSLDYSLSSFNSEFSPDEMGKISEMLAVAREFPADEKAVDDYIETILGADSYAKKSGADMSDEEFLSFFNDLKSKK